MMNRRRFFFLGAMASAAPVPRVFAQQNVPSGRLRVAVMGLGRGMAHVDAWLKVPNVTVAGLSEVDDRRMADGVKRVAAAGQAEVPRTERDFRRLLEDRDIDVLSIAAPNFWQTPAAVLACAAGKHVYVEKPGSHNGAESILLGKAAAHAKRYVQQGTQRRSLPALQEAVARIRAGEIGTVRSVRCWYDANRGPVKLTKDAAIPSWLDWALWQGPCPEQPYLDGLVHYNWHWRWHYGGGELANNGVHMLDLALWGLGGGLPERVVCGGGRHHFEDDQETPDTVILAAQLPTATVAFDSSSCHQRKGAEKHDLVSFYGDKGSLTMTSQGYRINDPAGKELARNDGEFTDVPHFRNLADAIRDGKPLNCDIATGQQAALICHLGNIAYRTDGSVRCDSHGLPLGDAAMALWSRSYRDGWTPQVG